ncbi:DUF2127 domain-containing protein [Enterovibrio norvegicus]|uniref:DUF2127 domain-containing protein n=1 Tax=Enterovibrio norvegicus TaxID=188144 RepID=UPI0024B23546|nr:DUF2127 domain-containing protein [Enterovibrio norvegicus]
MSVVGQSPKGLKAIAALEALKGVLSLAVGFALHELGGKEIQHLCEALLQHLHLNPASEIPSVIMHSAYKINDHNLRLLALGSVLYATIRLVEAFGLWRGYAWTEWFALASGAVYLPFEIYAVATEGKMLPVLALVVNLVVVAYMTMVILQRRKEKHALP